MNASIVHKMIASFGEREFAKAEVNFDRTPHLHAAIVSRFAGNAKNASDPDIRDEIIRRARNGDYTGALHMTQKLGIATPESIDDKEFDIPEFKRKVENEDAAKKQRLEHKDVNAIDNSDKQLTKEDMSPEEPSSGEESAGPVSRQTSEKIMRSFAQLQANDNQQAAMATLLGLRPPRLIAKSAEQRRRELSKALPLPEAVRKVLVSEE